MRTTQYVKTLTTWNLEFTTPTKDPLKKKGGHVFAREHELPIYMSRQGNIQNLLNEQNMHTKFCRKQLKTQLL